METDTRSRFIPQEQRFILPGGHSWAYFKAIQEVMEQEPGIRISYLDGIKDSRAIAKASR
jgi:hypothetical protein